MAVNPRFEISSNGPDGVSFGYSGTHRGHFGGGTNLERGSSFRENHDGCLVIQGMAGQSFSGSGSSGHGERQPLTQVLALDLISSGEQKYARQLELRRATIAAMGLQGEVHGNLQPKPLEQQGLEELKRIKASLIDSAARAGERSRRFAEATLKLDKYRASLQIRKRVRTEAFVHERPMTSLSVERPAAPGNSIKATLCASPNHASMADSSTPKEDKNKGFVPNKRIRTSMVDVRLEGRANTSSLQRSTGSADRDHDAFKTNSSLAGLIEDKDRTVSTASESWEKTKMKGRRSATKLDPVAIPLATNRTLEVEQEHKWGAQHRNSVDNRPRPSEGHGFRAPVHGMVSIHKVENAQQKVVPICPVNRNESDGSPSVGEKRDRVPFPEKERPLPMKNCVKLSHKEGRPLLSPTTVTKLKAARAPRSSAAVSVNPSSQHASRPSPSDAWDRAASGRSQLPVCPSNRKRLASSRPSSPPVAQWVGQRPQKMSRVARRMNLVPPTVGPTAGKDEAITTGDGNSGNDTTATAGARLSPIMPAAAGPVRRVASTTTISQNKTKIERATPSIGVSESDDSEGGDLKFKERWKKHGESEGRFATVSQKMTPLVVPGKKSHVGSKEEGGDGVRRQGRSSRGLIAVRETPIVTHVEKVDPAANAKQLRSARPGLDKLDKPSDVKPGRPPTKKGTADHKALTRPQRPPINSFGDVSGESDDDHEELMAAVRAAVNASAAACPSSFWKEMEPFFAYLTPDEEEGLRKQAKELEEVACLLNLPVSNNCTIKDIVSLMHLWNESVVATPPESPVVNVAGKVTCSSNGRMEVDGGAGLKAFNNLKDQQVRGLELQRGWWDKGMPLSQRLLSALIIECDSDDGSREDGRQAELQGDVGDGCFHDLSDSEQAQWEKKNQDPESEVETRKGDGSKGDDWAKSPSYDDLYTSNGHRHWDSESELLNSPARADLRKEDERKGWNANELRTWNIQYQTLKLDDRIALELQSVGLYPDLEEVAGVEDDEVAEELKKSHMELKDQIHTNKERLLSLGMTVSRIRATEERERERLAMLKLVEIAFNKRVGYRGGVIGASGSKSSASKAARAAALMFAKRTLARWQHFAETGESCFTDASLRDILFCVSSKGVEEKLLPSSGGQVGVGISSVELSSMGSLELKSAALEGPGCLCNTSCVEKGDKESSKSGRAIATSSESLIDKEDMWSSRLKERQVSLEDVVGSGNGGTKGKRSERERDGKGLVKEIGDTNKGGRQGLGTIKGERKTKTKPRQRTAPLLKAVNGLLGKPKESSPVPLEKPGERFMKAKDEPLSRKLDSVGERQEPEAVDLTHLPIPSMDDFVVNGDLEGQGQDLGSWLDFEDPGLPDAGGDFVGLDVPMDDLTDLAMMM